MFLEFLYVSYVHLSSSSPAPTSVGGPVLSFVYIMSEYRSNFADFDDCWNCAPCVAEHLRLSPGNDEQLGAV